MDDLLINIFLAYSREDSILRDRLEKHLSGLKRKNYINIWYDGNINAGKEWEKEIDLNLSKADIILLLISADFIASDYCYDVEMKKAISRHERGDAVIIPIILNPCDWTELPFAKIQALPQNGKPITSSFWENIEIALSNVALAIKDIVEDLLKNKKKHFKAINEILNDKESELRIILQQLEELKIEQEIIRESIEKLTKEKKDIEKEIVSLSDQKSNLSNSLLEVNDRIESVIKNEQIELNHLRHENETLRQQNKDLDKTIKKLEIKKKNIEEDIIKIKK